MEKTIPLAERCQQFLSEMKESFWGDVYGRSGSYGGKERLEADSPPIEILPRFLGSQKFENRLPGPTNQFAA